MKIDKNIFIEDLVREVSGAARLLMKKGLVCILCGEPVWGTLEEFAREKGVKNLDDIIEELNKLIEENVAK